MRLLDLRSRKTSKGQIGTFVAPVLDKASQSIVAKVTIAGVEVAALVDTGATTSCCRWDGIRSGSPTWGP